jgi:uncharacterized protein YggT (Ycf19 family)
MSWRMASASPEDVPWQRTLLRTLRRAAPKGRLHWGYPALLLAVLLLRGLLYFQLGSALHWVPQLDFDLLTIPFRSDRLGRMMLFSFLGFGQWLGGFYLWLLLLSALAHRVPEGNSVRHFVQINLGWPDRLPSVVKLLLPLPVVTLLWAGAAWWFGHLGLMPAPASVGQVMAQGGVLALGSLLLWQYLLAAILILFLIHSYVFIGSTPFSEFIDGVGFAALAPLRWVPLRLGKVDGAPVVALALVFVDAHHGERVLDLLFHRLPR